MYKTTVVCLLFFILAFSACTQNRGYRGGVRGSRTGNYNVEDINRTHRDIHQEYEKEQEEHQRQQEEQEDSYGY